METPLNSVRYYLSILYSKVYSDWTLKFLFVGLFIASWHFMGLQTINTPSRQTPPYISIYQLHHKHCHLQPKHLPTATCHHLTCSRCRRNKKMVLQLVYSLSQQHFGSWDHTFVLLKYATDWPSIISLHHKPDRLTEQDYHTLSVAQQWLRGSRRCTDTLCHFSLLSESPIQGLTQPRPLS